MKSSDLMTYIIMGIICIGILTFVGKTVYDFYNPEESIITFNITGITQGINATTLTSLHYECIKYCTTRGYDSSERKACWEQCSSLGEEQCTLDEPSVPKGDLK